MSTDVDEHLSLTPCADAAMGIVEQGEETAASE
jgi:hypothetical protein